MKACEPVAGLPANDLDTSSEFPYNTGNVLLVRLFKLTRRSKVITAKITSKGQVTIPKKVRERLGVQPGEAIGFEEKEGVMVVSKAVRKSPFDKWMGRLGRLKGRRSDDIVKEARGRDDSR